MTEELASPANMSSGQVDRLQAGLYLLYCLAASQGTECIDEVRGIQLRSTAARAALDVGSA